MTSLISLEIGWKTGKRPKHYRISFTDESGTFGKADWAERSNNHADHHHGHVDPNKGANVAIYSDPASINSVYISYMDAGREKYHKRRAMRARTEHCEDFVKVHIPPEDKMKGVRAVVDDTNGTMNKHLRAQVVTGCGDPAPFVEEGITVRCDVSAEEESDGPYKGKNYREEKKASQILAFAFAVFFSMTIGRELRKYRIECMDFDANYPTTGEVSLHEDFPPHVNLVLFTDSGFTAQQIAHYYINGNGKITVNKVVGDPKNESSTTTFYGYGEPHVVRLNEGIGPISYSTTLLDDSKIEVKAGGGQGWIVPIYESRGYDSGAKVLLNGQCATITLTYNDPDGDQIPPEPGDWRRLSVGIANGKTGEQSTQNFIYNSFTGQTHGHNAPILQVPTL